MKRFPDFHPSQRLTRLSTFILSSFVFVLMSGCISTDSNLVNNVTVTSPPDSSTHSKSSLATPTRLAPVSTSVLTPKPALSATTLVSTETPHRVLQASPTSTSQPPQPTSTAADKVPVDPSAQPFSLLTLDPIQIRSPAEDSWLHSPIPLDLQLVLGEEGKIIHIELWNDNGILLFRKIILRDQLPPPGEQYSSQIDFEIPDDFQDAFITIGVEDVPGMPLAVNTTRIRLLSSGIQKLMPELWQSKVIDIQRPAFNAGISGGMVDVSGLTRLDAGDPLKVQLVDMAGKVVGQRLAEIEVQPGAEFNPFHANIAYKIHQPTPARIIVFRSNPQSGETQYLASQMVQLKP
jgi:hypothetical protein